MNKFLNSFLLFCSILAFGILDKIKIMLFLSKKQQYFVASILINLEFQCHLHEVRLCEIYLKWYSSSTSVKIVLENRMKHGTVTWILRLSEFWFKLWSGYCEIHVDCDEYISEIKLNERSKNLYKKIIIFFIDNKECKKYGKLK